MGIPVWKPVKGYEGLYEVSNVGIVKSLFRYKKALKPSVTKNGYLTVELFRDKIGKRFLVHRIVAESFIPNPDDLPQVNHKDEDKKNNNVDNLEWCSAKYNMNYGEGAKTRHKKINYSKPCYAKNAKINGMKTCKPIFQFSKDGVIVNKYASAKEASRKTGFNHSHICECANGKRYKTVGNYIWKYERDVVYGDSSSFTG